MLNSGPLGFFGGEFFQPAGDLVGRVATAGKSATGRLAAGRLAAGRLAAGGLAALGLAAADLAATLLAATLFAAGLAAGRLAAGGLAGGRLAAGRLASGRLTTTTTPAEQPSLGDRGVDRDQYGDRSQPREKDTTRHGRHSLLGRTKLDTYAIQ